MNEPANNRRTLYLGPLPVELICKCLGLELPAGDVVFFEHAQNHAFGAIPGREAVCMPHLFDVVANPTHIGQQPKYVGKGFDLVRVVSEGPIVLVGIGIRQVSRKGLYAIHSVYPTDQSQLERRVRLGFTKPV